MQQRYGAVGRLSEAIESLEECAQRFWQTDLGLQALELINDYPEIGTRLFDERGRIASSGLHDGEAESLCGSELLAVEASLELGRMLGGISPVLELLCELRIQKARLLVNQLEGRRVAA